MNNQEKINKLINRLDYLFTSNKNLEQILSEGEIILEDLRLLCPKDKKEAIHELQIYSKALDLLYLITDIKIDFRSLKSQEEIIDYLELMDEFHNLINLSELNNKRMETTKRSLLSEYRKLPSLDKIREIKDLERSFGSAPNCPKCNQRMVLREKGNEGSYFWGCRDFPKCWGIIKAKNKKNEKAKISKFDINNLNEEEHDLFEIFKVLRKRLAKEREVSPFIIATNDTLIDMAIKKPTFKSDLKEVYRVGDHFINEFGDEFIKEINRFLNR